MIIASFQQWDKKTVKRYNKCLNDKDYTEKQFLHCILK